MSPSIAGDINVGVDDEEFGDFVFSSPSSSSHAPFLFPYPAPFLRQAPAAADEGWADFLSSSLDSPSLQPHSSSPFSPPFDRFSGVSLRHPLPLDSSQQSWKGWEKPKGAIPLSIFGEKDAEEPEQLEHPGVLGNGFASHSLSSDSSPTPTPTGKLNDLLEVLYDQAGSGMDQDDDFDEGSWEFKDALSAYSRPQLTDKEGGAIFGLEMVASTNGNGRNQVDANRIENGWKVMDQFKSNSHGSIMGDHFALHEELTDRSLGHNHSVADKFLHEMLPSLENEAVSIGKIGFKLEFPENAIRNGSTKKIQADQAEVIYPPESEKAEMDMNAAIELFVHSFSVLHILRLASKEQQLFYINAWSKLASACAQELQLGAKIWTKSLDGNISKQLLVKGNKYFVALGEVFRVSKILKATIKFYMPWLLSNLEDSCEIETCLEKCNESWINSGLEEALQTISNEMDLDIKSLTKPLLESIKLLDKVIEPTYWDPVFHNEHVVCKFCLLPIDKLPEINTVVWNGDCYITKLANFWANRISPDPPELPSVMPS